METLGAGTGADGTTVVGLEELEESGKTEAVGVDTGTGWTTGDAAGTGTWAGSNCCTCGTCEREVCEAGTGSSENCMICKDSSLLGSCFSRRQSMLESVVG